jgi:alkylation response protein AidB-like acyl-CoA dehydrogenase
MDYEGREEITMDFSIPAAINQDLNRLRDFIRTQIIPDLSSWTQKQKMPDTFLPLLGAGGWYGIKMKGERLNRGSVLREAMIAEALAKASPGLAIVALAHIDLGLMGLFLFGSQRLHQAYGPSAVQGKTVMCLGNTENKAGSDVAGVCMSADKVDGGWRLNGTKAYVTNGLIADLGVITAVSDPQAERNQRLSMYLVNLNSEGVGRKKLNKQVWIPSDLTRLRFKDVFVPDDHLLGIRGRGLQQVLEVFTSSRVPIAALTLGTAVGAFDLAHDHMQKRTVFGKKILDLQAKAFELADFYAKIEAARLVLHKACWKIDRGEDFRQASSVAKYLAVEVAREVTLWAADIFGAASVIFEHPIHKYPLDVWAASLGEGTQDIQKLIIFRELMKNQRPPAEQGV